MCIKEKIESLVKAAFGAFTVTGAKFYLGEDEKPGMLRELVIASTNEASLVSKIEFCEDPDNTEFQFDIVMYGRRDDAETEVALEKSLEGLGNFQENIDRQIREIGKLIKATESFSLEYDEFQTPFYNWIQ